MPVKEITTDELRRMNKRKVLYFKAAAATFRNGLTVLILC